MPAAIPTPANARRGVQNGRFAQIPHLTGLIIGGYAALCLLWSVSPLVRLLTHRPREYIDQYYFDAPDTSIVWALFLALLAGALTARKRIAWWILTGYLLAFAAINAATIVVGGPASHAWHPGIAVAVQSAVIAVLIAARGEFYTRVRPGAGWKAAAVFIACLGASTLLGWGLVELSPGTLPAPQRFWWALNRVTAVFIDNDEFSGRPHIFVSMLLGLLGALALLAAVTTLFRSQHAANALTGADESALRGLLTGAGADDSLGYFATRRDKEVVFAPNGKAAITFRVELGVCLASGDPIGVTSAWPQAILAWLAQAQRFGWVPAVMGTSERGATAYQRAGLSVLQLGDEAVIYPVSFTLSGPAMKPVRQANNRLRKQGFSVLIRRHRYISAEEMAEVSRRADTWRDTSTERGFSMALGRLGDPLDGECLLVEAIHQGRVAGMLSFVPWGSNGVSLDVMRRDPAGPNGVVELMVSAFAARAEEYGVTRISLNFAVFRSVFAGGERIGAGPVLRMTRRVLLFFSRWWQLEALYRSNMKYQPQWVPRFLCYDDSRKLARVGIAAALAEGFLPRLGGKKFAHKRTHGATPPVAGAPHSIDHAPESDAARPPRRRRPEQVRVRMRKLARLTANGTDAYPPADPPTHTIAAASFAGEGALVRIAGRVVRLRDFGGVIFVVLRDETGQVQILIDRATVGAAACAAFSASFDLGDLAEFSGVIGRSRNGEMSVLARRWRMNGKSFHPLPDKWKGLANPEALVRQRYLDLAVNQDAQQLLRDRSTITRSLRDSLHEAGFLEVETPILQRVHGGANAAPFRTHINAYDLDLYLRIAPELYLKRLCVGGVSKVFELGRAFRNEGADHSHNPEFTILEAYEAHSDYNGMRRRCHQLIQQAAIAVHGQPVVMRRGAAGVLEPVDISGDWPVISFYDAVSNALGEQVSADTPLPDLVRLAEQAGISYHSGWDAGQIALELYERLVESRTAKPTFYQDFPLSVSPLTRSHRAAPGVAERWDLVAWGTELGTAYSELTDPVEQRRRLTEQSMLAAGGDPDAMELDEDFLHALEHAMPPTGGLGLGVDRVVMLITGRSIRETLPFPLVK